MYRSQHTHLRFGAVAAPARPGWQRMVFAALLGATVLVVVALGGLFALAAATVPTVALAPATAPSTRFDGRYLVAASDADMVGTAYADGRLMQIPGTSDTLSLVELPLTSAATRVSELPVSNSVTSWPQISAVSPDGRTIYVVETAAPVDDTIAELPPDAMTPGRVVTVVELGDGAAAAHTRTVEVGQGAAHVALSPDGAHLAVGLTEPGRQLAILPTATLDDPRTFRFFAIERADQQPAGEVSSVFWHPNGAFLAIGIDSQEIMFYRVEWDAPDTPRLRPHGSRISGGASLTYGQFTRDGRFYLTSEINWEHYPGVLGNLINPRSELLVVRFDSSDAGRHTIVARTPVGLSAEAFAVSPQEDLIVTVDMGRTYLPDWLAFWPGAQQNTLSLLGFDRDTGALQPLGIYGFAGVLPEAALFDSDGDALGVVIYNQRAEPQGPGLITFWNVLRDGTTARLERTAVQLEVARGPHALNLIR